MDRSTLDAESFTYFAALIFSIQGRRKKNILPRYKYYSRWKIYYNNNNIPEVINYCNVRIIPLIVYVYNTIVWCNAHFRLIWRHEFGDGKKCSVICIDCTTRRRTSVTAASAIIKNHDSTNPSFIEKSYPKNKYQSL